MIHTALILGHAAAGVVSLVLGCMVLRPPGRPVSPAFRVYWASLVVLVALLLAVVVHDWPSLSGGQRVTFGALSALGVYTLWRGLRARSETHGRTAGWRSRYVDHVGFTVISLFDGFAIVAAIDLGAPLPVVIGVGVGGVVAGIAAIERVKRRELAAAAR